MKKEQILEEISVSIKYIYMGALEKKIIEDYRKSGVDAKQIVSVYHFFLITMPWRTLRR